LAGSTLSSPAIATCVCQRNRKAVRFSRGGKLPTTNSNLRRSRIHRNLCSPCNPCNPCSLCIHHSRARRAERRPGPPLCSPCRKHRMSRD
jgi:hypothetical protein